MMIGLVLAVSHYVIDLRQLSTFESLGVLVVSGAYYKMKLLVVVMAVRGVGDLLPNYYQIAIGAH
jgi:hypothetical protein